MWWGGLKKINPKTLAVTSFFAEPSNGNGLSNDNVLDLYCDSENNIWASNYRGGVSCYSIGKGVFLDKPQLPENSDPGAIEQDLSGRIWIKDTPGSLMIFDPVKQSLSFLQNDPGNPSSISTGYISAIYCDKSGMVWLATDKGIAYYDPRGQLFSKYLYQLNLGKRAYCNSFFDDGVGHLWIAVYDVGLVRYDLKTGAKKIYTDTPGNPYSINHKTVNGIASDASGKLWLATKQCICVIHRLTGLV